MNDSTLCRCDALLATAGMLLGAEALAAPAEGLKARARKNILLGVHTGPYTGLKLDEAAARMKDQGFRGVLTEFAFADVRFDPLEPEWKAAGRITSALERNGIEIVAV